LSRSDFGSSGTCRYRSTSGRKPSIVGATHIRGSRTHHLSIWPGRDVPWASGQGRENPPGITFHEDLRALRQGGPLSHA
jgi:hypothetical protein